MNWVRNKLRVWLFPEYGEVRRFMLEVGRARIEVKSKSITFKEPVILVGNLSNCKVDIKPTIKPEIILSKLELESLLSISGNQHIVTYSTFQAEVPSPLKVFKKVK
ncbi:MAG: hypothetical protein MUP81_01060 [Dehalococcoidia bacterium]|nr:hypothetical protein [Dehalococcoidia bacterium]